MSRTGTSCCRGAAGGAGGASDRVSFVRDALAVLRLELVELELVGLLVLPELVLLRGVALTEPDFEDEVDEEGAELFVDVFAVVDDFGACVGSSSP